MDVPSFTPERLIVKQKPLIWLPQEPVCQAVALPLQYVDPTIYLLRKWLILKLVNAPAPRSAKKYITP
jgi:hypothetical protein